MLILWRFSWPLFLLLLWSSHVEQPVQPKKSDTLLVLLSLSSKNILKDISVPWALQPSNTVLHPNSLYSVCVRVCLCVCVCVHSHLCLSNIVLLYLYACVLFLFTDIHYLSVHVCIQSALLSALRHRVGALQISCIIIIIITTSIQVQFFCNCPSVRLPASWKLQLLLIRVKHNNNNKKLARMQTTPTFHCSGCAAAAQITTWCGENLQRHHLPFHPRTAWMESDMHIFYVCDFCHHCCHPKGGWRCLMSPPCLESQGCHLIPLYFCLVLLLFLSYLFSACWSILLNFLQKILPIFFVKR